MKNGSHSAHVIMVFVLLCLSLAPRTAADPPEHVTETSSGLWCLPQPMTDMDRLIVQSQETLYQQLFEDPYDACEDMPLWLDSDVAVTGQWVNGTNSAGEPFTVNVIHLALRIDDWTSVPGIPPDEAAYLQDRQASFTRFVGHIYGPLSAVYVSAIAYSATDDVGNRMTFMVLIQPFSETIALGGIPPCPEGENDPLYVVCIRQAADDRADCRRDAYDAYDECLSDLMWEHVFWDAVACGSGAVSLGAGFVGCGWLYIRTAQLGFECDQDFEEDLAKCEEEYIEAVEDCCEQAAARREAEQSPPAVPK